MVAVAFGLVILIAPTLALWISTMLLGAGLLVTGIERIAAGIGSQRNPSSPKTGPHAVDTRP